MLYQIKVNTGILNQKPNKEKGVDFELKLNSKLGNIFHFLPYGRINKKETGIGATTLELCSERNSIIVLPTRSIARSKVDTNAYYYSSDNSIKLETVSKKEKLKKYLSNPQRFKKILVVADSLPSLIEVIGNTVFNDYFLLLDEIDSMQKDSTFRNKMETCIEFYKKFDIEKRAVVSATLLSFSDPVLSDERLTNFRYEKCNKGEVCFIQTETLVNTLKEKIQYLHLNSSGKIVIALNNIAASSEIADYLANNVKGIEYKDITILCGKSQKNATRIVKYSGKDIENSAYPTKINFITSAYFYGYDIQEEYHLLIASDGKSDYMSLSESECIQIKGRCREPNKLLSFSIVYSINTVFKKPKKISDLVSFSKKEISALQCISLHYDDDEMGAEKAESTRDLLVKNSGFGRFNIVCKDSQNNYVTSFLNIDAFIENQRVRNLVYYQKYYLAKYFKKEGYTVFFEFFESKLMSATKEDKKQIMKEQHQALMSFLFNKVKPTIPEIDLFIQKGTSLQIKLCEFYKSAAKVVSTTNLKIKIADADTMKKASDLLNSFKVWTSPQDDFVKRNIQFAFKNGQKFTAEERIRKITILIKELKLVEANNFSDKKLVNYVSSYIEFKNSSKKVNGKTIKTYTVISNNPKGFKKSRAKK
jgi:hypothetical protein